MSSGRFLLGLLILILVAHYVGLVGNVYITYRWYDILMHIVGGAWVALLFFYLAGRFNLPLKNSFFWTLIAVLGFVALVGILWEFYEYLTDVFILHKYGLGSAQSLWQAFDTLKDLFDDIIGAIIASGAYFFLKKPSA